VPGRWDIRRMSCKRGEMGVWGWERRMWEMRFGGNARGRGEGGCIWWKVESEKLLIPCGETFVSLVYTCIHGANVLHLCLGLEMIDVL